MPLTSDRDSIPNFATISFFWGPITTPIAPGRTQSQRREERLVDIALGISEVDADERHRAPVTFVGVGVALLANLRDGRRVWDPNGSVVG